jgi:thiol-disulfide isomerase/thioredoxin
MHYAHLTAGFLVLAALPALQTAEIAGKLSDRLVAEDLMARIELKPSSARDLPGLADDDRVFRATTPQFRPAGAPEGLSIALVETKDATFLYVDTNVDGRLTASERTSYAAEEDQRSARDVSLAITLAAPGAPALPFRCRVTTEDFEGARRYYAHFTASFRAEGHASVGGRQVLMSLPFDSSRGIIDVRRGKIGIDANGDGRVDLHGLSGPEVMFAKGDRVILRVGDKYVSVESADFVARSFTLREHAAEEYTVIDAKPGASIPDFEFKDFNGRARRLSEFRGKYLLLDFWGSWCAPCLADLPHMKAAYERFRHRGFEILGIDYEYSATTDAVRVLLNEKGVEWPNATPESVKDLVEKRFRIQGFPTLILLDPDGVVVETRPPMLSGTALMSTLEKILQPQQSSLEDREVLAAAWKYIKEIEMRASVEILNRERPATILKTHFFIDRALVFDRTIALCGDPPTPGIACIDEVGPGGTDWSSSHWPSDVLSGEAARGAIESFVARNRVEQAMPKIEVEGAVMVTLEELVRTAQTRDCGRGYSQFSLPGYSSQGHALVYVTYNGGPLCGHAALVVLTRAARGWQGKVKTVLWFS